MLSLVRTTETKLFGTTDIYRIIVDAAEASIWIADKDDKITFVNKKLTDLLRYPRDQLIGKKVFDFTDEKNRVIMKKSIERSRKGERDTYAFSLRNKDGNFIPLQVVTTPMQDKKGRYIGTVQLGSDISSQWKIENELRESRVRSDMYLDLLSHDIRNMDQISIGYLEMAINKLDSGECLTKTDRELIEKPLNALHSSAELIDTVKNLQKAKSAQLPFEKIDLGKVVSGVVNGFSSVPGRAVKIHYNPVKDCFVEANYLLKEVFINLIGNAIEHSSGLLDIGVSIGSITSDGVRYYAVTVEDNGPGIPDTQKSKLFDQRHCEGVEARGKGLGLCLVKLLVERFRGKINVEDRVPGDYTKGARFVVMLPAVEK